MITFYRTTDAPAFRSEGGLWFCPSCSESVVIRGAADMGMEPVTREAIDAQNHAHQQRNPGRVCEPNRCQDCGEVL